MKSVWVFPSSNINIGFVNGAECSKGTHIKAIRNEVNNKFVVSKQIIETNYYKKTLLNRTHIKGGLTK